MTADRFAEVPLLLAPALAMAEALDTWWPEYLRALERQRPELDLDDLPIPAATIVRHADVWRIAEQAATAIIWPSRVSDFRVDPDDGVETATVEVGLLVVAQGPDEQQTARNLDYLLGAARAILMHQRGLGGITSGLTTDAIEMGALDPGQRGRTRAGATVMYSAPNVVVGHSFSGPPPGSEPRPDPRPPWPPVPTVATTHVRVEATSHPNDPN
jgi:hypothetical protein